MTLTRRRRPTKGRKIMGALQRLLEHRPRNPELVKRLARGTLVVSLANVAREAGIARRLISVEKTLYPAERAAILAHCPTAIVKSKAEIIKRLTAQVNELIENHRARAVTFSELSEQTTADQLALVWTRSPPWKFEFPEIDLSDPVQLSPDETENAFVERLRARKAELQQRNGQLDYLAMELLLARHMVKLGLNPYGRPLRRTPKEERMKAMNIVK